MKISLNNQIQSSRKSKKVVTFEPIKNIFIKVFLIIYNEGHLDTVPTPLHVHPS